MTNSLDLFHDLDEGDTIHVHGTGEPTTRHVVESVDEGHKRRLTLRRTEGRGGTITLTTSAFGSGVILGYDARKVRLEPDE